MSELDTANELRDTYDRRFSARQEYRRRVWAVLTRDFFQRFIPENAAVLDLGCGWGEFINQIRARQKFGMDLNPASLEHLDSCVVFLNQNCAERWDLADESLDVVFTSNFFEHLPDKSSLRATIEQASRCLKPGGTIICLGPNAKYLAGSYWDFWDHALPLTELALAEGLELVGFRMTGNLGRFLPYTMASGFQPPLWTVSLYLRLPVIWRVFGRQFLVVGVKPLRR